jgi:hypothetical protein
VATKQEKDARPLGARSRPQGERPPIPDIKPHALYDYAEVAAIFGCSVRQVRRWCHQRKVPFVELPGGQGWRFSGQQILDMQAEHTVMPADWDED